MMILLAMKARAVAPADAELARLIDKGALKQAAAHAKQILGAGESDEPPTVRAAIGRALVPVLLVLGRDVEAEALTQQQLRLYAAVPRAEARMLPALDQGLLMLAMNRIGRAAESISVVVQNKAAPALLRIEGLLILSECLLRLGGPEAASRALDAAQEQARHNALNDLARLLDLQRLDQRVRHAARPSSGSGEHALCMQLIDPHAAAAASAPAGLLAALEAAKQQAPNAAILAQRIEQLDNLLRLACGKHLAFAPLTESLHSLREQGLAAAEERFRIEAGLACLVGRQVDRAAQVLDPLIFEESRIAHHKFAHELQYCIARLHTHKGRPLEAMRAYGAHADASRLVRDAAGVGCIGAVGYNQDCGNAASSAIGVLPVSPRFSSAHARRNEHHPAGGQCRQNSCWHPSVRSEGKGRCASLSGSGCRAR